MAKPGPVPTGPMWFDPAPPGYPWTVLMVPVNITSTQEAQKVVDQIREAGNQSMKRGDFYDALWKYNHALVLCRDHKLPPERVSVVSSNCSQACLNLKYYFDAFSHANDAIATDPRSPILDKAFYRRAEAARLLYVQKRFTSRSAVVDAVKDYCQCFIKKSANTKAICEAILLAVDHTIVMEMVFMDSDIESGITTKILTELLDRPDSRHSHLHYLVHKIPFRGSNPYHFDCSSIQFSTICKKSLGKKLIGTLCSYGMTITPEDVAKAVELLPDTKTATLEVIASRCYSGPVHERLSLAYAAAERTEKPTLLECLRNLGARPPITPQERVLTLKGEGNDHYKTGKYDKALAKYYKALAVCQQHKLSEDEALIRGNCAQACLNLELYRDAYDHACECLRLDPQSSKGYYRRAEALRKMLDNDEWRSSRIPEGKTFSNVVEDYFQCHRKSESLRAIHQAIIVATNHDCTKSLPELTGTEIECGLPTKILTELIHREDSEQKHFSALFFSLLPEKVKRSGVDVSLLQVTHLLKEKSITSAKLVERLISLGMKVNEGDVSCAVQVLKEHHKKVLQLLAKECARTRKSTLTAACQEAIKAKKLAFIACLIENGGAPDVEDLKELTGWPHTKVDQAIDTYLHDNTHQKKKKKKKKKSKAADREEDDDEEDEGNPNDLPSPVQALMTVKQTCAVAESFFMAGEHGIAEQKYREALAVCAVYNFKQELSEVLFHLAQIHLNFQRFDTAFTYCSDSLREYPSAKVHFLRALVLQKAYSTPFVAVPPNLGRAIVVSDYCDAHRLDDNSVALSEAIVFAVEHKLSSMLKDRKKEPLMSDKHVKNGFTTELLIKLLSHGKVKEAHVKVLLEIPIHCADPPLYDGSKIPVSTLLRKKITNSKILNTLFDCGMVAKEKDVKLAIESLPGDSGISTLDTICSHVDRGTDLDRVCHVAMKSKKIRFILCLVRKGSKLPCSSQAILQLAIEKNLSEVAESLLPFCTLREVDLGQLMATCKQLVNHQPLIVKMIDGGVNPSGLGDRKPLAEVTKMSNINRKVDLICVLLEMGCDPTQLCVVNKGSTTPIHVAVSIGVEAGGSTRVLDAVVTSKTFSVEAYHPYTDSSGNTPLHLAVVGVRKEYSFKLMKALIEVHKIPIDPMVQDRHGKRVADYITGKKDIRLPLLSMAVANRQQGASKSSKKKRRNKKKSEQKEDTNGTDSPSEEQNGVDQEKEDDEEEETSTATPAKRQDSYEILSFVQKLELHLRALVVREDEYFITVIEEEEEAGEDDGSFAGGEPTVRITPQKEKRASRKSLSPEPVPLERQESGDIHTVMSQYGLEDFDGLPWEVEVTNSVLKFFKNSKEHPYTLRLQAANTVYQLAEGKRSMDLSKKLNIESKKPKKREPPDLFEARINEEARIIWQVAIQFSPRRTGEYHNPIYAQVIRIWEIVPDHSKLTKTIKDTVVRQIELSNEKGLSASLNVPLLPQREQKQSKKSVRQQERLEVPVTYTQTDLSSSDIERFTPAASPKEDEFNVTTFYSFSGALLKSMLTGNLARRDFPFKEWPKEHEIINLPDTESILLLGRSGTGKTTCCLYRLWNEFKLYWDRANIIQLPRKPLVALKLPVVRVGENEEEEEDKELDSPGSVTELTQDDISRQTPVISRQVSCETSTSGKSRGGEGSEEDGEYDYEQDSSEKEEDDECTDSDVKHSSVCSEESFSEVEEIEEHLHQVFVTKNYVLCAQMKRRFYDMAASHDFLDQHMELETKNLPHSFDEIDDLAYPLFLTARQFYILLDNSISSDHECFFRPREKDGSLRIKIVSSDYDHEDPDTLLDLEDSDNEGDDIAIAGDHTTPFATNQQQKYVEVTALYFSEKIWPEISRKCKARHLDPLLVWIEIQSFIKGSRIALLKGSALPLEEYRQIGNKMAPNFSSERDTIYNLYQCYERHLLNKRHSVFLFDECDLVHDLHRRLRQVQDLPWSIHTLYIDEVQDFTQAELALYLHCCRHPNSLFFTGDTAQSIMRGIAFRFQDLRSSFHAVHEVVPQVKVPQQPHTLTINFRSHAGILKLAGSIIDLLQMFFKGSIDYLPADEGMFPGPTPVVLASCEESDLALLLSSNKRESSRIEFGAHQVVLVQSKEAKERLPSILKGAIVLTIFESKGLEFDDVLLYNFFNDSVVDEKGWRVVTAYLEEHTDSVKVKKRLPSSSCEPRSNKFDEKQHKSLNSELKYLYTAITRAKCNLWIYDSNTKKRLPMFDLWYKRDLVKVVGDGLRGAESQHSLIFASISTSHQWKVQGDYFMRRSRWEQAKHCYDRAGADNEYLSVEAKARFVVQQASKLAKPQLYLEAAVDFLYRDELVHNVQCLLFAAQCLRRAKPQRFASAANLFERLGKYGEALKCYRKIKDTKNCVRLLEREKRYDEAVKMFRAPKDALAKAVEYTAKGIHLSQDLLPDNLSYVYASQCAKHKDKVTLLEMLAYMSDPSRKARFLKICGLYNEALKEYVNDDELDDAYRLASGQCMFLEGREIAKEHKDPKKEAEFVFHQVHSELLKIREKSGPFPAKFETYLHELKKAADPAIKSQANLLLGMVRRDAGLCRVAHGTFLRYSKAAALEAFNELTALVLTKPLITRPKPDQVLTACTNARDLEDALRNFSDIHKHVKQALAFYGVQKVGDVYLTPPNHNVWMSAILKAHCMVKSKEDRELEGHLRLDVTATRESLAAHVGSMVTKWLMEYSLESTINKSLRDFRLHRDLQKKTLTQFYTRREVPLQSLNAYFDALVNHCRLGIVLNDQKISESATSTLLSLFSPLVSMQIPLNALKHVTMVRGATSVHKCIHRDIDAWLHHDDLNQVDELFSAWRACCLSDGKATRIEDVLQGLEDKVNDKFKSEPRSSTPSEAALSGYWRKDGKFQAPQQFKYWKLEDSHYHIFNYWIHSCELVRINKPVWAAKQAIHHFLGTISQRKSLYLSVMNLVNVLIVHGMSVLAMLTQLNHQLKNRAAKFVVPLHYLAVVELYDALNCHEKEHITLFSVCTDEVRRSLKSSRQTQLHKDCCSLMGAALRILLGNYNKDITLPREEQRSFNVLRFAFKSNKFVSSGAARHCLVLALTVFANISPYQERHRYEATKREFVSFFNVVAGLENVHVVFKQGRKVLESPPHMLQSNILRYVGKLLAEVSPKGVQPLAFMVVSNNGRIEFNPLPSGQFPPPPPSHTSSKSIVSTTPQPPPVLTKPSTTANPQVPRVAAPTSHNSSEPASRQSSASQPAIVQSHPHTALNTTVADVKSDTTPKVTSEEERLRTNSHVHTVSDGNQHHVPGTVPAEVLQPGVRSSSLTPETNSHTHPIPTRHLVQMPPSSSVEMALQQTKRRWENLPPVLDGLLQPVVTQTEQSLGQAATWNNIHQHIQGEPLYQTANSHFHQQESNSQQSLSSAQHSAATGYSISHQSLQQQQASYHASALQQHAIEGAWDYSPFHQPYNTQLHASGMSEKEPWPHVQAYKSIQNPHSATTYYHQPLSAAQDPYQQHASWDPLTGNYHSFSSVPAVSYGEQYHFAPYDPLASGIAAEPLHRELSVFAAGNHLHGQQQLPHSLSYTPELDDSASIPPSKPTEKEFEETATLSSSQIESQPRAEPSMEPSVTDPSQEQDPAPSSSSPLEEETVEDTSLPGAQDTTRYTMDSPAELEPSPTEELEGDEDEHLLPGETDIYGEDEDEEGFGDTEDYIEEEEEQEDDRDPGMLTFRRSLRPQLTPVDDHLIDTSIVTEEFCSICGVDLLSKHETDETGETEEEDDAIREEYELHVRSENHSQNYTLHKNFKEKLEESYSVMVEELSSLIRKCERVQAPSFTRLTDDMNVEVAKCKRKMAKLQENLNWRQGLALIDKATDKFQTLLSRGNKEYEKFRSENPRLAMMDGRGDENDGDSDTEFHEEMNKVVAEMDDDFTLKLRSEEGKMESRTRKRNKRKK